MSLIKLTSRLFATAILAAGMLVSPTGIPLASAAERYTTVEPPQPSDSAGKIEVLEFFSYTCPHCSALEPLIEEWVPTLPEDVAFRAVPVAFNASMVDLQKLYYSLQSLGRLDLHPKVFEAIHKQHKRIYDAKAITDWVADQGVDKARFEAVFNSFGVNTKVRRADELARNYGIDGTPSIAVGGRYVTSPSQTNSYEGTITEAQALVERARAAK